MVTKHLWDYQRSVVPLVIVIFVMIPVKLVEEELAAHWLVAHPAGVESYLKYTSQEQMVATTGGVLIHVQVNFNNKNKANFFLFQYRWNILGRNQLQVMYFRISCTLSIGSSNSSLFQLNFLFNDHNSVFSLNFIAVREE